MLQAYIKYKFPKKKKYNKTYLKRKDGANVNIT